MINNRILLDFHVCSPAASRARAQLVVRAATSASMKIVVQRKPSEDVLKVIKDTLTCDCLSAFGLACVHGSSS